MNLFLFNHYSNIKEILIRDILTISSVSFKNNFFYIFIQVVPGLYSSSFDSDINVIDLGVGSVDFNGNALIESEDRDVVEETESVSNILESYYFSSNSSFPQASDEEDIMRDSVEINMTPNDPLPLVSLGTPVVMKTSSFNAYLVNNYFCCFI